MTSGGSTATGRGSALIIAAAAGQAGGYRTEPSWPPTPQARSGSTATSAAQHTAAAAGAGSHRRTVTTAAAPATA